MTRSGSMDGVALKQVLAARARELGFHGFGVAPARVPEAHLAALDRWLAAGMAADIPWMVERREVLADLEELLPGVRSVVCVLVDHRQLAAWYPDPDPPPGEPHGRVARYARGRDYHIVLKKRLAALAATLEGRVPGARTRACVDAVPLLERALAWRAGLGFLARNTMLITPGVGSYTLLGELLTDVELPPDEVVDGTCGTCTRCLDACPTAAFPAPGVLDARRCISTWTLEVKGELPLDADLHGWAVGCDVCQEVCPYNRLGEPPSIGEDFRTSRAAGAVIREDEVEALGDDAAFLDRYAGTVVMRPGRVGVQRNLRRLKRT